MSNGHLAVIAPVVTIIGIIIIIFVLCARRYSRHQTAGYVTTDGIQQPPAQRTPFFTNPIPGGKPRSQYQPRMQPIQQYPNNYAPIQQGIPQSQYQPHMYPTQQYPNQYAPAVNTYGGQQPFQPGVQVGMMQHAGNPGNPGDPGMQPSPQPPFNPAWTPSPYGQQSGSDLPPPYEGVCNPSAPKSHDFK